MLNKSKTPKSSVKMQYGARANSKSATDRSF